MRLLFAMDTIGFRECPSILVNLLASSFTLMKSRSFPIFLASVCWLLEVVILPVMWLWKAAG